MQNRRCTKPCKKAFPRLRDLPLVVHGELRNLGKAPFWASDRLSVILIVSHPVAGLSVSEPSPPLPRSLLPSPEPLNRRFLQTHCSYSCQERKTSEIRLTRGGERRETLKESCPSLARLLPPSVPNCHKLIPQRLRKSVQWAKEGRGGGEAISPLPLTHTTVGHDRN